MSTWMRKKKRVFSRGRPLQPENKNKVGIKLRGSFLGTLLILWKVLYGVKSVPKVPCSEFFTESRAITWWGLDLLARQFFFSSRLTGLIAGSTLHSKSVPRNRCTQLFLENQGRAPFWVHGILEVGVGWFLVLEETFLVHLLPTQQVNKGISSGFSLFLIGLLGSTEEGVTNFIFLFQGVKPIC